MGQAIVVASFEQMVPFVKEFIKDMKKKPEVEFIAVRKDNPECGLLLKDGRKVPCWAVARTNTHDWYGMTLPGKTCYYSAEVIA